MTFRDVVDPGLAARYRAEGWWGDETLGRLVRDRAASQPDAVAYVTDHGPVTWSGYDDAADALAAALVATGLQPGERVAVLLPDGAAVHAAFLANERAGLTTVGIGSRAGDRELVHLVTRTGAVALVSHARHRDRDMREVAGDLRRAGAGLRHHVVVDLDGRPEDTAPAATVAPERALGPDDLFLVNSTSGTTGLPKCVMHTQNRWMYFHQAAVAAGALTPSDVVLGGVPAPFGFGLWTAHFTPTLLGVPCVVTERFSAAHTLELIARERVTVLCVVSTQFVLMLSSPEFARSDLSSLRVMFTGGEAVPYAQARDFEDRTGAAVLQFYGSNESGLACGTRLSDPQERRLRTAGRRIDGTELRLYEDGKDVTVSGHGQPGTRGPAVCLGYLDDPDANAQLFTADGFVLHADICTVDEEGWVTVVGRTSDIIIRGGKNISAAQVEEEVSSHPAVALAAAVAMPDDVFGERVCVFVELRPGAALSLEELVGHLERRGTSRELFPERLVIVDELPRSSGGKVAKSELRRRLRT